MGSYESWGRYPKADHKVHKLQWRSDPLDFNQFSNPVLAYGRGRSYGDSCLNDEGVLLDTSNLKHFIHFDHESGILECESGVSFSEILDFIVPRGWFLPVVPGTRHISLGGAIANDIHGKNHHRRGSFGGYVISFELIRSDQEVYHCSAESNPGLYQATIGGLGLTGLILSAKVRLIPIKSAYLTVNRQKFYSIEEFVELSLQASTSVEHLAGWFYFYDTKIIRGFLHTGNHCEDGSISEPAGKKQYIPSLAPPGVLVNSFTMKLFNKVLFARQIRNRIETKQHYVPFLFPLDAVKNWNKVYGADGFFQLQCIVDIDDALESAKRVLALISSSDLKPFLSVMKIMGPSNSPGMLSFPKPGLTLCFDYPNAGLNTRLFLEKVCELLISVNGRVYPAKDALMPPRLFRQQYSSLDSFIEYKDPLFSSSFWRRMTER